MHYAFRSLLTALLIHTLLSASTYAATEFHFDFGPPDAPLADGFVRAGAADAYSAAKGYGWTAGAPEDFTAPKPPLNRPRWWHLDPHFFYDEVVTDLRFDGVESEAPFAFKVDLPPGPYRVLVTAGHLRDPRYSMDFYANGALVAKNVEARHWLSSERGRLHYAPGHFRRVAFPVEIGAEGLTLEFKGDDSEFRRLMAIEEARDPPQRWHDGQSLPREHAPWSNIGGPFSKVSLMGLQVYPDTPLPLAMDPDTLALAATGDAADDPAVQKALEAFNGKDFKAAQAAFRAIPDPLVRGLGLLALAGRPDFEDEYEDAPAAVEALREAVAKPGSSARARETLESAEIFLSGLEFFRDHALPGRNGPRYRWRAVSEFNQFAPGDFVYYKSLIYQGRILNTEDPHQWAWQGAEGKRLLGLAEEKFPDNRFVRFVLHGEWKPYGDGSRRDDWAWVDYESTVQDSPEWVRWIYPAFQACVDWAEYWIRHRQQEDGNIGGGWGDDVEIVGAFGYMGYVSRDLSEILIPGTAKLVEGMWQTSEVDPELGYCLPLADSEHTAEWTGNTLGMMVLLEYGNPLWIERSLKTARLMRDLWTAPAGDGSRQFRANYFGAANVGSGDQKNDSWINYRAIRPATAVLWYNQNPDIAKLTIELADSWVAAAMSTDRGKPAGVIPAQLAFPDRILGGTNSPNWWTASHPPGTVNYDWPQQSYKEYIHTLLARAYDLTGDRKYLEPMRLEYELAVKHGQTPTLKGGANLQPVPDPRRPTEVRLPGEMPPPRAAPPQENNPLEPGSEEWVGANIKAPQRWLAEQERIEDRTGPLPNNLTKDDIVVAGMHAYNEFKRSWPRRTTEAGPTDRIAFVGLINPFLVYTGGRIGGPLLEAAVTYNDTGREFAAAVIGSDPEGLRILFHSLAAEKREIGFLPWQLEPGARYLLRYGPDAEEDGQMDVALEEREVYFRQLGTEFRVSVEPRMTYVIEMDQIEPGRGVELAPDPAITSDDIRRANGQILARVHNIGSAPARDVWVAAYDGNPKKGGREIGRGVIPNIEPARGLILQTTTIGFHWSPTEDEHEIHIVVDPDDTIQDEISTFNNTAKRIFRRDGD